MVGGGSFFPLLTQIGAMVLLRSPQHIKLESCACDQIEALEEGNRWLYPDDAGDLLERGRNAANLISDSGRAWRYHDFGFKVDTETILY